MSRFLGYNTGYSIFTPLPPHPPKTVHEPPPVPLHPGGMLSKCLGEPSEVTVVA